MDLKELQGWQGDVGKHWYYASKAAALDRLVQPIRFHTIADIGAGSGFFAKHLLERRGDAHDATCVDINYERDSDEWIAGKRVAYRREAQSRGADLYLLMDVLEHVEDDVRFLRSVVRAARCGAHFVITVPAFKFLWSGHDEYLGHYRRYTLPEITDVARRSGLEITNACYYFAGIFPPVAALRMSQRMFARPDAQPRSDMRAFSAPINRLLRAMCGLEERIFMNNRAFGLTAFLLGSRACGVRT